MSNNSLRAVSYDALVHQEYPDIRYTVITKANDNQFEIFLPSFTLIIILMVIGLPGNILTLLVYTRRLKKAVARQFLITMATCDFLTCAVVMPTELVIMTHFFDLDLRWLCKFFRWFAYSVSNISCLTLLAIAFERYRLVCKPWKPKFTDTTSRRMCYVNIIISVATALPMFFVYGTQTIPLFAIQNITDGNRFNTSVEGLDVLIYGKSCLMDDAMEQLAFSFSFVTSVAHISSFIIIFLTLIVLFSHIIRSLAKRQKESICQKEGKIKESSAYRIQKIIFMMIILTLLYGISYLPCIGVVCLRLNNPAYYNKLSAAGKAVFQFLLKSYFYVQL
ncbi:tachykinin-like peptides receptor 99D [Ruditapes philippinarum]|uniref:tachykinin-like peptides receptor 99D n=1 Tax=Ruditapes philippinarum TaxID=129788 RepID=UPI00295AD0A7|nr:tachykinin-like peptides receptor 99D [Ruditapes philippinarum]